MKDPKASRNIEPNLLTTVPPFRTQTASTAGAGGRVGTRSVSHCDFRDVCLESLFLCANFVVSRLKPLKTKDTGDVGCCRAIFASIPQQIDLRSEEGGAGLVLNDSGNEQIGLSLCLAC